MKTYYILFHGKKKGAIGAFQHFGTHVKAEDEQKAVLKLYEEYKHIHFPRITEVPEEPDVRSTGES